MDKALENRLEALEARAGIGRTHVIWVGDGADPDPAAAIARLIKRGRACEGDRFLTASWHPAGEPELPMSGDVDRFGAAPKPPDPAVPWSPGGVPIQVPAIEPLPANDRFEGRISYFDGPWD